MCNVTKMDYKTNPKIDLHNLNFNFITLNIDVNNYYN